MSQIQAKLAQAAHLLDSDRSPEAHALLSRIISKAGADPHANRLMAECLLRLGQVPQAVYYAQRAANQAPDNPDVLATFANSLWPAGRTDDALAAVRRAVESHPRNANARGTLVNFLVRHELFAQAAEQCRLGLEADPSNTEFATMRSTMLLSLGRPEESYAILARLREQHPGNLRILGSLVPIMNYLPGADPAVTLAIAREYGQALARAVGMPPLPPVALGPADADRPLRVALLSPDLRAHPMRFFIEPFFEHLDRGRFELTSYFTGAQEDEVSLRLKSYPGVWRHVPRLDPVRLAQGIRHDRIDALIDLAGHTQHQRLVTMHLRPAPLQLTFLGYPGTTGVRAIDFQVVDSRTDPPGAEASYTERLLRLDPCFVCLRPAPDALAVGPLPGQASGRVTFGSFNTLMKMNERVVSLWSRLLARVPGSRLMVKNTQLMQPEAQALTRQRFLDAGCTPAQLDIRGHKGSHADHLGTYSEVDIALDTFPYNGATTTCEALHMGVPVVGIAGNTSAGRVGESLLSCMGMGELVAPDEEQYLSFAARLAGDLPGLSALRAGLRRRFLASPICDERAWVRRFEEAIRAAWRTRCATPPG